MLFPLYINNDNLVISNISAAHIPVIKSWYNDTRSYEYISDTVKDDSAFDLYAVLKESMLSKSIFFCGVFKEDKPNCLIGCIRGRVINGNNKSKKVWIHTLMIDKNHRGIGYGKRVIKLVLDYMTSIHNVKESWVSVHKENIGGIIFWEKLGYKEVVSKTNNSIIMCKVI